jgi:hypothetical protein
LTGLGAKVDLPFLIHKIVVCKIINTCKIKDDILKTWVFGRFFKQRVKFLDREDGINRLHLPLVCQTPGNSIFRLFFLSFLSVFVVSPPLPIPIALVVKIFYTTLQS